MRLSLAVPQDVGARGSGNQDDLAADVALFRAPATSHDTAAGFAVRFLASASAYSAWLALSSVKPITSSPGENRVTPGPGSATIPARSLPWPDGKVADHRVCSKPLRILASPGFIPAALTRTRTWPAPGTGRGTSTTFRISSRALLSVQGEEGFLQVRLAGIEVDHVISAEGFDERIHHPLRGAPQHRPLKPHIAEAWHARERRPRNT